MMTVKEFYDSLEMLYPRALSCEWDNDGIMCCEDLSRTVGRVLISLDATKEAILKAKELECDVLLTHHPMLFKGVKDVRSDRFAGERVICALRSGVTVISLHTRLDAGAGGVNDCLAEALGFSSSGSFGDEGSPEIGRIIDLEVPTSSRSVAQLCKDKLGSRAVRMTGENTVSRICVVGGSGGDFIRPAINAGADLLITGECSYNAAQDAAEEGLTVIEAGHFETEAPVCKRLRNICFDLGLACDIFESKSFDTII